MNTKQFKALVVTETAEKTFCREITTRSIQDLPPGDVLIGVRYSSLNYKDALSATGNRGVTRNYPHTPGIDAAGIVEESRDNRFKPGEEVIVTSYDLGMNTAGGFGEYIRVPGSWVVKRPITLFLKEAMSFGTAGYTAGLSVAALIPFVTPEQGEILVTGATGGVGSLAVAILAKIGYQVVAISGKPDAEAFLTKLGAKAILRREDAADTSGKPVLKARWAGVIDTVGGAILATAIKSTQYNGVVTCCGMVAGAEIPINVFPFILRNVKLLGIDSQNTPLPQRTAIWEKLAEAWKPDCLADLTTEIGLADLETNIQAILKGEIKGRIVIKL